MTKKQATGIVLLTQQLGRRFQFAGAYDLSARNAAHRLSDIVTGHKLIESGDCLAVPGRIRRVVLRSLPHRAAEQQCLSRHRKRYVRKRA
jgi:hypothetical protein